MGEIYETEEPPKFRVRVTAEDRLYYVTLVRNNRDIFFDGGASTESKFSLTDDMIEPGEYFYYVRVQQRNDQMAWSSPIWINYKP